MARRKMAPVIEVKKLTGVVLFSGLFMIGLGCFLFFSFISGNVDLDPNTAARDSLTGIVGAWLAYGANLTYGAFTSYLLAGLVVCWGFHVIRECSFFATWPRVLGGVLIIFAIPFDLYALMPEQSLTDFFSGGLVADVLAPSLLLYLGRAGVIMIASGVAFLGSVLAFGGLVFDVLAWGHSRGQATLHASAESFSAAYNAAGEELRPRLAALLVSKDDHALVLARQATPQSETAAPPPPPAPRPASSLPEPEEIEATAIVIEKASDSVPIPMAMPLPPVVAPEEPAAATPPPEPAEIADANNLITEDTVNTVNAEEENSEAIVEYKEFEPYATAVDAPPDEKESTPPRPPLVKAKRPAPPRPQRLDKVVGNLDTGLDYQLPPLNTLDEEVFGEGEDARYLERRAKTLEKTLDEFKIQGKVIKFECGPRVTMFEMMLAPGIKLSRIIGLADNISMALKAPNVRIIAPIPGRNTIGVEIPNKSKELVCLRGIVSSLDRSNRKEILPVCLGKDVAGRPLIADLAKMPHLLIAGATGSGKSVCINSVILSFLMCCKPNELKLIMVDPKVVELSRFKSIPHLMSPVITDMKRAVAVLDWACQKMDERYEQLSQVSVNNIAKFNALGEAEIRERLDAVCPQEEIDLFPKSLPYVVIIIDELADLMMVAGKDVEQHITRLAAKSRAVGIHLILATQRPSVDVITGLIKANMPSRIAFQVASKVDSRTILDGNGAETLLGAGDMLFLPPGVGKVSRAQGVFVSDEELFRVVDFCMQQMAPDFHADLEGPVVGGGQVNVEEFDDRFVDSGLAILESGRGSVSLLQRKLGIGYGRASRIIDQLAAAGVLGPFREGKAREIMMSPEEFMEQYGGDAPPATNASKSGKKREEEPLAGVRDDEKGPADLPWDD